MRGRRCVAPRLQPGADGVGRVYLHTTKQPKAAALLLHNDLLRFYRDQQLPVAAVLTCADSTSLIAAVVVNDLLKEHCIAPISLTICDSY